MRISQRRRRDITVDCGRRTAACKVQGGRKRGERPGQRESRDPASVGSGVHTLSGCETWRGWRWRAPARLYDCSRRYRCWGKDCDGGVDHHHVGDDNAGDVRTVKKRESGADGKSIIEDKVPCQW